jgi:small conductance mechanosensitive channel
MDVIKQFLPNEYANLAILIFVILLTLLVEWISRRALTRYIRINSQVMQSDPTNFKFLANALRAIIYSIGLMLAIREYPPLKSVAGSLLAGAGIFAVAIGFASQQAFSNIISGIFLVIFKPFRVNDRLRIKDVYAGTVEDITLRHTVMRDTENKRIVIPNSVIATEIIVNSDHSDGKICKYVEFCVNMNTNIDKAKRIIFEEIEKHPFYIDPRKDSEKAQGKALVEVRLIRFTDFGMVLRGALWTINNANGNEMQADLNESIKKRFDTEGVEMANPHFVIVEKGKTE